MTTLAEAQGVRAAANERTGARLNDSAQSEPKADLDALLQAAADAADRALSSDSVEFLNRSRQLEGE